MAAHRSLIPRFSASASASARTLSTSSASSVPMDQFIASSAALLGSSVPAITPHPRCFLFVFFSWLGTFEATVVF